MSLIALLNPNLYETILNPLGLIRNIHDFLSSLGYEATINETFQLPPDVRTKQAIMTWQAIDVGSRLQSKRLMI
jgi:hypothetical protein